MQIIRFKQEVCKVKIFWLIEIARFFAGSFSLQNRVTVHPQSAGSSLNVRLLPAAPVLFV